MKKQMGSSVLRLLFVVLLPVALPFGCNKSEGPGPAEKAGKVVDKAAVEAADAAKKAGEAVREGAKKVATVTEDAAVKTGEAIERGAEKASDAAKDAAHKAADAVNTAVPTPKKK